MPKRRQSASRLFCVPENFLRASCSVHRSRSIGRTARLQRRSSALRKPMSNAPLWMISGALPMKSRNSSQIASNSGLSDRKSSDRSEEHTSELQSLMRISYAVFCLKKKTQQQKKKRTKEHKVTYIEY